MDKINTPIKNGKERNEKGQFVYGNTASVGHGRKTNTPSIVTMIRTKGNDIPEGETKTRFELAIEKMWELALKGNIRAFEIMCNRVEGRAFQQFRINIDEKLETRAPFSVWSENTFLKDKLIEMGYDEEKLKQETEKGKKYLNPEEFIENQLRKFNSPEEYLKSEVNKI